MRNAILRRAHQVSRFFLQLKDSAKQMANLPAAMLLARMKKARDKLLKSANWFAKKIERGSQQIQKGLQTVKNTPQQLIGWMQTQTGKLGEKGQAWRSKIAQSYDSSQRKAHKAVNQLYQQLNKSKKKIKAVFQPLRQTCRSHVLPFLRLVKSTLQSSRSRLKEFLKKKHQQCASFCKEDRTV